MFANIVAIVYVSIELLIKALFEVVDFKDTESAKKTLKTWGLLFGYFLFTLLLSLLFDYLG